MFLLQPYPFHKPYPYINQDIVTSKIKLHISPLYTWSIVKCIFTTF